jgi:hypothetical protein
MVLDEPLDLAAIRREAATVRMLLQELEQLTGGEAQQVGQQLGERLAVLAGRLLDASRLLVHVRARAVTAGLVQEVKR